MFAPDFLDAIVMWMKISLKSAFVQGGVVQLDDASRGFGRHADG